MIGDTNLFTTKEYATRHADGRRVSNKVYGMLTEIKRLSASPGENCDYGGLMAYSSWHYSPCVDCSTSVLTRQCGGHDVLCKDCRKERRRVRDHGRYNSRPGYHHTISVDAIVIVYDPTPYDDGGYRCGARFDQKQVECMLRAEYCGFAIGTRVMDAAGAVFVIRERMNGKGGMELCPM